MTSIIPSYPFKQKITEMGKLFILLYIFTIASAGFIIMPLNLADDVVDLKNVLGFWPNQTKLDRIRQLTLKERFYTSDSKKALQGTSKI